GRDPPETAFDGGSEQDDCGRACERQLKPNVPCELGPPGKHRGCGGCERSPHMRWAPKIRGREGHSSHHGGTDRGRRRATCECVEAYEAGRRCSECEATPATRSSPSMGSSH